MKCCHDPLCPTRGKVDSAHQDLEARIWQRRLLPQCLVKSWCVRIQGKHILILCPAPFGMGHTIMGALLGQQFHPFDSILLWVTFSSWLQRNPGSPTQPGARLPGALVQEGRCMFVTPLGTGRSFTPTDWKVVIKLLWEDPKGLECCVGSAPLYCQGKEALCEDMHGRGKSP